jgi:hypothetical protein
LSFWHQTFRNLLTSPPQTTMVIIVSPERCGREPAFLNPYLQACDMHHFIHCSSNAVKWTWLANMRHRVQVLINLFRNIKPTSTGVELEPGSACSTVHVLILPWASTQNTWVLLLIQPFSSFVILGKFLVPLTVKWKLKTSSGCLTE